MERELLDNMKDQADELTKLTSKTFDAAAGDLDEIYKHVCYPREGNLDGLCLKELESAVEKQSKMLSGTDLTKFRASDLISAGNQACGANSDRCSWKTLGCAVGSCFQSVPDTNVLFGLLGTKMAEKKQTKPRRPVVKDVEVKESQPERYISKAKDIEIAQARRLSTLETAVARQPEGKASLFDTTLDSKSFEQTVENLFDLSFLVDRGVLGIGVDESTGLPYLDASARDACIISLTPSQWDELSSAYGLEEPLVGHRS
ncbi:uncharacterized protein IUM83_15167 [Phytophthora cinnamomi]|uniref:uncharacterized protein n=1 Tax=Phytophthora cinnamomi TaxID=4785 RepID=UPI00355AB027|nr:hypothetical protein IUM83_15167 [Phytophthora cinnamomi]